MSVPMDPPYCLVYPTSYVKGIEPNHLDTRNSPMGMRLHRCVCHATLQVSNNDPKQCTQYVRSHLIQPRGAQYNDRLYPSILEPWNHCSPLIDPTMGSLAHWRWWATSGPQIQSSKGVTGTLSCIPKLTWPDRRQKVYLPAFQGEIPVPPAPSYRQVREPAVTKQSLMLLLSQQICHWLHEF